MSAANAFFESLDARVLLSAQHPTQLTWDDVAAGKLTGSGIRLDLVVLHELGHSMGLGHSGNPASIMYAYYNPNYNINNFSGDPVIASFRSLYSNVSTSPWKDSLDAHPGNGKVDITYSYVPDGTSLDKSSSRLFGTLDAAMGRSTWQGIFAADLNRWAGASNGKVAFASHSDGGLPFNFSGKAQNDSHAGDIRFGAHRFDGPGKTLAHTFYPPPTNNNTAAGDLHLDYAEKWVSSAAAAIATPLHVAGQGNNFANSLIDLI
jgi:matrixin